MKKLKLKRISRQLKTRIRKLKIFSIIKKQKRLFKVVRPVALVGAFAISLIIVIYPFWPLIKYYVGYPSAREFVDLTETAPVGAEATNTEDNNSISVEEIINLLVIPKIGVRIPIVEGSDESALEYGAWRLPESSTPDQRSNTAIAAHRFKYVPPHEQTFYLLDKLVEGDTFQVLWGKKEYRYRVISSSVVAENAIEVIEPTSTPTVTLITCSPLFSDEKRLVVQGELMINP